MTAAQRTAVIDVSAVPCTPAPYTSHDVSRGVYVHLSVTCHSVWRFSGPEFFSVEFIL